MGTAGGAVWMEQQLLCTRCLSWLDSIIVASALGCTPHRAPPSANRGSVLHTVFAGAWQQGSANRLTEAGAKCDALLELAGQGLHEAQFDWGGYCMPHCTWSPFWPH